MPTGGAAGTGVSEAKLAPGLGQAKAVAAETGATIAAAVQAAVLTDSAVIRELAVPDLGKLTQILQPTMPPDQVTRVDGLIHETVSAIQQDRREWAVGRFIEAVTSDPSRVDEFRSKPEFDAIRANVDVLLNRLTNVAKMDAETKLAAIEQVLETAGWPKLAHWETASSALVQIGHRLIEAGGYANFIRTSELATALQASYTATLVIDQSTAVTGAAAIKKEDINIRGKGARAAALGLAHHLWDSMREKLPIRVEALWEKAPLLVILGAWFSAGLLAGVFSFLAKAVWPDSWIVPASNFGFQLWGLGFLAIVGLGFWARVRRPNRSSSNSVDKET